MQIIAAPPKAKELSPRWHAQQIGSALGAAADLVALECATRGAVPPALLGACYDGLLRPVDDSGHDQLGQRVKNAAIGALSFGTLAHTGKMVGEIGERVENAAVKTLAQNTIVKSAVSGAASGIVTTIAEGGKSLHDFEIGTYTSVLTSFGLGALHIGCERQNSLQQQKQELTELRQSSETDYLTGLGNRRGSDIALKKEFDRSIRIGKPMSLIYGDLDGFKAVNDHLGHEAGDQVLKEVGQLLNANLRKYDHAARSGGDEFTLVLPETDVATAQKMAQRLMDLIQVKASAADSNQVHTVGISLGVVTRGQGENCMQDFQRRADQEMYRIKKARKEAN